MRVLAFEDHYDIEAMLAAGGVNTDALVIEQRWNSTDAVEHDPSVRSPTCCCSTTTCHR